MNATLRDLVLAVQYGDASLVGESVGYIVLGAADRAATVPRRADLDSLLLTGEGEVALDAAGCSASEAERSLRALLGSLLTLVRSPCPNLERVAQRSASAGLAHLVVELEAALVPVNRKAARRSISRLVREARRSAARAEQSVAVAPVVLAPTAEAGLAVRAEAPFHEGASQEAASQEAAFQEAAFQETTLHEASLCGSAREDAPEPWDVEAEGHFGVDPATSVAGSWGPSWPGQWAAPSPAGAPPEPSEAADEHSFSGREQVADLSPSSAAWGATSVFEVPLDDEFDQAETRLRAPVAEVAPPSPVRPIALYLHSGRGEVPADLPLIAPCRETKSWRPSDASELLTSGAYRAPSSELYKGLKRLSQVDFSPARPSDEAPEVSRSQSRRR